MVLPEIGSKQEDELTPLFHVVLLDDDDHTYDYVVEMLTKIFFLPAEIAFQHAVEVNDHGGGASLAAALDRNIMHGTQLAGEWQPNPSVQNNAAIFASPPLGHEMPGVKNLIHQQERYAQIA